MTIFHKFTLVKDNEDISYFQIIDSENFDPNYFPNSIDGFVVRYDGIVNIDI